MKKSFRNEVFAWVKTIIIATVMAVFIRSFLFSSYVVQGESMMPTLQDGNLIVINKVSYEINHLQRFDVIVFHANQHEDYVKRIIGLPGDHIKYKNDVLYVNGKAYDEPYLNKYKAQLNSLLTNDFTVKKVPEGKLFVLGDNRRWSLDSRDFGFIDVDQVVGKVNVRVWPVNKIDVHF